MIEYKVNLNRFYNTKTHKIISKKEAMNWSMKHGKLPIAVKGDKASKKHAKRLTKIPNKRVHNRYARPSYKKLYEGLLKRDHKLTNQMKKLEKQYAVGKFHPFIVNKTKHGEVSPKSNYKDVIEWSHDHGGKLFVVAALGNDDQSIVKACGSVHKNEAAGFGATELLPQLNEIFDSGFND